MTDDNVIPFPDRRPAVVIQCSCCGYEEAAEAWEDLLTALLSGGDEEGRFICPNCGAGGAQ